MFSRTTSRSLLPELMKQTTGFFHTQPFVEFRPFSSTKILPPLSKPAFGTFYQPKLFSTQTGKQPSFTPSQLLQLVVNYQPISSLPIRSGNAVYQGVDHILQRQPELMFGEGDVQTYSYETINTSPFHYAYWSDNFTLYNLMLAHAEKMPDGLQKMSRLANRIDAQAYSYSLKLMTIQNANDIPPLALIQSPTPILYKSLHSRQDAPFYFIANTNGSRMKHLISDTDECQILQQLPFPKAPGSSLTLHNDKIAKSVYETLLARHTVSHFSLEEFISAKYLYNQMLIQLAHFIEHNHLREPILKEAGIPTFPSIDPALSSLLFPEFFGISVPPLIPSLAPAKLLSSAHALSNSSVNFLTEKVGGALSRFPAWIASIWCSGHDFAPSMNYSKILKQEPVSLEVIQYDEELASRASFYDLSVGVDKTIVKQNSNDDFDYAIAFMTDNGADSGLADHDAMKALHEVIRQNRSSFKLQLQEKLQNQNSDRQHKPMR